MEGRLVLKDCSLYRADGRVRSGMAVVVEGVTISRIAPDAEVPVLPGDWEVRCGSRLVAPGLVDCHTRLVGGQLSPWRGDHLLKSAPSRFEAERRFDAAATVAELESLTAFALARGLREGVSMFVEHLHAPRLVEEALAAQARVAERLGARLVNSHASCSEGSPVPGPAQVEANARYVESRKGHGLVRGALGVYASFCADDDLLRRTGRAKELLGTGAHFRLAESDDDLAMTWARHGTRVVTRFDAFGLLGGATVAAHARAIDRAEAARLAKTRTLVALGPRNAQTMEGGSVLGMEAVLINQNLAGLGTDGTCSFWDEVSAGFAAVMALSRAGRMLDPDNLLSAFVVGGAAELCTMIFGLPSGTVEAGALADLVVYDLVPPHELQGGAPHLLLQLGQSPVAWTIVNGRVVVREGQLVGADYAGLAREAAKALEAIWGRAQTAGDGG